MKTLQIKPNESVEINVTVRDSDIFSNTIQIKFESHLIEEGLRYCDEMFLTPIELNQLGQLFTNYAADWYKEKA